MRAGAARFRRTSSGAFALFLISMLACREFPKTSGTSAVAPSDASALLSEVVSDVWRYTMGISPLVRLDEGLPVDELWDFSHASALASDAHARDILDRLARIDTEKLDQEEVLTVEILQWQLGMKREGLRYFWHSSVLTPYATPTRAIRPLFTGLPVASEEDRRRYLSLLEKIPSVVRDLETVVREQLDRGIVASREALPNIQALLGSFNQPVETSFFQVAAARLKSFGVAESVARSFQADVAAVIEQQVNPAWQGLQDYATREYKAHLHDGVGVRHYPDGADYYRYLTRHFTTFEISPEEVQKIGVEMIFEIEGRMDAIQREVEFEGTREAFRKHLKTDPSFFAKTSEEVATRIANAADAFNARVDEFFLQRPRASYGVRRLALALEGSMTYGYYDPPTRTEPKGFYNYNGSMLDQRGALNLEGLAYHELVPGHHFQITRQRENRDLPDFRRYLQQTAFSEGWGSYASQLGLEAGLLENPYSRYGFYVLEIFLANRLVIDPGMNYFGWSLDKAREQMRRHTLESEAQVLTETLRYGADHPGQALAYQMGKRKILDLRRHAQDVLGENFDIREFHEIVIGSGVMPLAVLEKHVERYIENKLARS